MNKEDTNFNEHIEDLKKDGCTEHRCDVDKDDGERFLCVGCMVFWENHFKEKWGIK